jgi:hypothetical protein
MVCLQNKYKRNILYLLISGNLLFSCKPSTQVISDGCLIKRKYNKGWYANKKAVKNTATQCFNNTTTPLEVSTGKADEDIENISANMEYSALIEKKVERFENKVNHLYETRINTKESDLSNYEYSKEIIKNDTAKTDEPVDESIEKQNNALAILSALLLIYPAIFYSVAALLSPFDAAGALIDILLYSAFLAIIAGIILAIIANNKVKKNSEKYKKVGLNVKAIKITLWVSVVLLALVAWLTFNSFLMLSDLKIFVRFLIIPMFVVGYLYLRK